MTPELLLTPNSARAMLRIIGLRTGFPIVDDDLVQEALLRSLRAFSRSECCQYPRALFAKIVRDTVYDHWRSGRKFVSLEDSECELSVSYAFEDSIDRKRTLARVLGALNDLQGEQRELIELCYFQEFSIAEIAERFGKSRSAIKMSLLRGRRRILDLLKKSFPST